MTHEGFSETVANNLGIPSKDLYGHGLTLSEVLARSPKAINSIDLMEAAATAIGIHGLEGRLEIPTFDLSTSIDKFMEEIASQINTIEGGEKL